MVFIIASQHDVTYSIFQMDSWFACHRRFFPARLPFSNKFYITAC